MHRHTKWGIVAAILSLTLISTLLISLSVESTHATSMSDDFFPFTSSTGPNPPAGNSRMTYEETDPYATVYSSSQQDFQFHLASGAQGVIATDIGYWSDTFSRVLVRTDDPNKTLHVFYAKGSGDTMSLWWKRSIDNGATWIQETQIGTSNGRASLPTATVGPNGKDIHISYCYHSSSTNHHWMFHRKLSWNSGTNNWDVGSEETVYQGASGTSPTADSNLVVDSGEIVHIVWTFYDNSATYRLYYEDNAAGSWSASPTILAQDNNWIDGGIELDSQRNLDVVASYNNAIQWRKATYSAPSTWTWAASWTSISGSSFTDAWSHFSISMDRSDRLHVAWGGYATIYRPLKYARKNADDSWQATQTLDSGNNHCYAEISAYQNRVYISATYNSGNGQIVYYESTNAGASFGSRTAITSDSNYNLRFESRISRYGVNPSFEGAWRSSSGPSAPYTGKFARIQRDIYFYTDRYPSTGSTAQFTGTWQVKIYVSQTSSGNTLNASIGLTGNGVDTTEYETPLVVKTGISSVGEYTISGFDFSSFPTPLSASPINGRRLFVHFGRGTNDITLRYGDKTSYWEGLTTGTVVPERLSGLLFAAPFIPLVAKAAARRSKRKSMAD